MGVTPTSRGARNGSEQRVIGNDWSTEFDLDRVWVSCFAFSASLANATFFLDLFFGFALPVVRDGASLEAEATG
jgi:hypothetical protein